MNCQNCQLHSHSLQLEAHFTDYMQMIWKVHGICLFGEITNFYRWICIEEQKAFIPSDRAWWKSISVKIMNIFWSFSSLIIKSSQTSKEHSSTASWLLWLNMCITACHFTKELILLHKSSVSFCLVNELFPLESALHPSYTRWCFTVKCYSCYSIFSAFFCGVFDIQMQVSSHSPAHLCFSHFHCLQILSVYSLASAPKWNIRPTSCQKVL